MCWLIGLCKLCETYILLFCLFILYPPSLFLVSSSFSLSPFTTFLFHLLSLFLSSLFLLCLYSSPACSLKSLSHFLPLSLSLSLFICMHSVFSSHLISLLAPLLFLLFTFPPLTLTYFQSFMLFSLSSHILSFFPSFFLSSFLSLLPSLYCLLPFPLSLPSIQKSELHDALQERNRLNLQLLSRSLKAAQYDQVSGQPCLAALTSPLPAPADQ